MKSFISLLSLLIILVTNISNAQNYNYKKFDYKWETEKPEPIAVKPQFANDDAVILQEETTISLRAGTVTKHLRIKFFLNIRFLS
jgi:hypothetical protein